MGISISLKIFLLQSHQFTPVHRKNYFQFAHFIFSYSEGNAIVSNYNRFYRISYKPTLHAIWIKIGLGYKGKRYERRIGIWKRNSNKKTCNKSGFSSSNFLKLFKINSNANFREKYFIWSQPELSSYSQFYWKYFWRGS